MTDRTSDKDRDMGPFKEECEFCQENLEAEALNILEPAEHARMQRHLQWCGPCRRSLAGLHKVVDLLPLLADTATPSPMAKARLFQQVADDAVTESSVNFGNPWMTGKLSPARPASSPVLSATLDTGSPSWKGWLSSALIAPLAIALIVLGAWTNALRNDLDSMEIQQANGSVANIPVGTNDSPMQIYSLEPSCPECDETPVSGHLGGDPDDNVGILVARNLNPNEQHQVWCESRDGEQLMVSDLQVEQSGDVVQAVNFPDAIGGYSTIYVTRYDGTEEMRVALHEEIPPGDATPSGDDPVGD
jgi:hypothetical protein